MKIFGRKEYIIMDVSTGMFYAGVESGTSSVWTKHRHLATPFSKSEASDMIWKFTLYRRIVVQLVK